MSFDENGVFVDEERLTLSQAHKLQQATLDSIDKFHRRNTSHNDIAGRNLRAIPLYDGGYRVYLIDLNETNHLSYALAQVIDKEALEDKMIRSLQAYDRA